MSESLILSIITFVGIGAVSYVLGWTRGSEKSLKAIDSIIEDAREETYGEIRALVTEGAIDKIDCPERNNCTKLNGAVEKGLQNQ